jgi:ParB family chromosome partitioning protein
MIPVGDVRIAADRKTRRTLRDIETLAASIREVGLINPITVNQNGQLIAGWHRLEAVKLLGWSEIPASVVDMEDLDAELAEIDENLVRHDLEALDYAEEMRRRKVIYLQKHPETGHGQSHGGNGAKEPESGSLAVLPFTRETAKLTQRSRASVQNDVRIAEKLTSDVKALVRDTDIAKNKSVLLELTRYDDTKQFAIAERLIKKPPDEGKAARRHLLKEAKAVAEAMVVELPESDEAKTRKLNHLLWAQAFDRAIGRVAAIPSEWGVENVAEAIEDGQMRMLRMTADNLVRFAVRVEEARPKALTSIRGGKE